MNLKSRYRPLHYGRVKDLKYIYVDDHEVFRRTIDDFFGDSPHFRNRGGPLHPDNYQEFLEHLGGAVGAIPGSNLYVYTNHTYPEEKPILRILVIHPSGLNATRYFYRDLSGNLAVENEYQDGKSLRGTGYRRTVGSINSLRKLGVKKVTLDASGDRSTLTPPKDQPSWFQSGYVAWPRMGFDGRIPLATLKSLPPEIRDQLGKSRSIAKLHSIPGGKEAWTEHGQTTRMRFWTNSPTFIKRLVNYVKDRRRRDREAGKKPSKIKHSRIQSRWLRYYLDPVYHQHFTRNSDRYAPDPKTRSS